MPIWEIWDPERIDEHGKKCEESYSQNKIKFKETIITTTLKVTNHWNSTSRAPDYKGRTYSQATFDDLETFELKKNNDLFCNAFND